MSKQKQRVEVSGTAEPLMDNPFAALAEKLPKDLPREHPAGGNPPRAEILRPEKLPFRVDRTRKGGYDIAFEHRAKGKGVTVLRRVQGDAEALLKALKRKCGAGGTVNGDAVELQGDHRVAIEQFLRGEGL